MHETAMHQTQITVLLRFTTICTLNLNKLVCTNKQYNHITVNIKLKHCNSGLARFIIERGTAACKSCHILCAGCMVRVRHVSRRLCGCPWPSVSSLGLSVQPVSWQYFATAVLLLSAAPCGSNKDNSLRKCNFDSPQHKTYLKRSASHYRTTQADITYESAILNSLIESEVNFYANYGSK